MKTENLSTLKIHKLTQEQYDRELAAGRLDENALYLTPDEGMDLSPYATVEQLETLVGDTSVSAQISEAISKIDFPVDSVNGKTGAVQLTASDVGALPNTTVIPSIAGLATEAYVNTQVGTKVDKVDGKGLSTNDYTTTEKNKLAGIDDGANKTTVDSALSTTSANPVQNKVVTTAINNLNTLVGDKSVSEQINTAIAPKANTSDLTSHTSNKSNPHGVDLPQLGVTATAAELNYVKGVTSSIQTQLNKKADDYSIELYNGTSGNPKPVRFLTVNYSSCGSENGVAIKIGMVSGHGNGSSYAFLQDAIIKVTHTGAVSVDNFKYYGAETALDGARQFGDIFWVIDTTNKIVDFYCLMGQYARLQMTPYKRVTYSTGGIITQDTSASVYSSGDKSWANNSNIALHSHVSSLLNRTNAVNVANTNYTTLMARGTSLNSTETNPSVNGAICWTYE